MSEIFDIPAARIQTVWTSPENFSGGKGNAGQADGGRKGNARFTIKAGESAVLADIGGTSGVLRRIWITLADKVDGRLCAPGQSPSILRGMRLDIYWDGEATPAVSAPLGDFFGLGLGRMSCFSNHYFSSAEGRSFNCVLPMPFRTAAKVVVTNEGPQDQERFFYDINFTTGDRISPEAGYLHTCFRRERATELGRDYEFVPSIKGRGRFLGVNFGVIANTRAYGRSWWGEGEFKAYLDGDNVFPSLCGTGAEDYVGTGWSQGVFTEPFQGCTVADRENMEFVSYRFHVPDPIYFYEDIRVTMQQIGFWGPDAKETILKSMATDPKLFERFKIVDRHWNDPEHYRLFERSDDWSSCSYLYLNRPDRVFPELVPYAERIDGLRTPGAGEKGVQADG